MGRLVKAVFETVEPHADLRRGAAACRQTVALQRDTIMHTFNLVEDRANEVLAEAPEMQPVVTHIRDRVHDAELQLGYMSLLLAHQVIDPLTPPRT